MKIRSLRLSPWPNAGARAEIPAHMFAKTWLFEQIAIVNVHLDMISDSLESCNNAAGQANLRANLTSQKSETQLFVDILQQLEYTTVAVPPPLGRTAAITQRERDVGNTLAITAGTVITLADFASSDRKLYNLLLIALNPSEIANNTMRLIANTLSGAEVIGRITRDGGAIDDSARDAIMASFRGLKIGPREMIQDLHGRLVTIVSSLSNPNFSLPPPDDPSQAAALWRACAPAPVFKAIVNSTLSVWSEIHDDASILSLSKCLKVLVKVESEHNRSLGKNGSQQGSHAEVHYIQDNDSAAAAAAAASTPGNSVNQVSATADTATLSLVMDAIAKLSARVDKMQTQPDNQRRNTRGGGGGNTRGGGGNTYYSDNCRGCRMRGHHVDKCTEPCFVCKRAGGLRWILPDGHANMNCTWHGRGPGGVVAMNRLRDAVKRSNEQQRGQSAGVNNIERHGVGRSISYNVHDYL